MHPEHCTLGQFWPSQRSLHNTPIFRLLLKVAVNGTHQCDSFNFCGSFGPQLTINAARTRLETLLCTRSDATRMRACRKVALAPRRRCSAVARGDELRAEAPRTHARRARDSGERGERGERARARRFRARVRVRGVVARASLRFRARVRCVSC